MTAVHHLTGDCRAVLATLAAEAFDCVVTSPPYWGLRDYGVAEQIGLEPTLDGYLAEMVGVCRELRRVLKPGGTFWLNVGDSYSSGGRATRDCSSTNKGNTGSAHPGRPESGLKPKDLCMVPNRLAILLQADGWYVRSEIIWHKPNPMPESVRDRPTSAHEKVWLLTKGERYFYDVDASKEAITSDRAPSRKAKRTGAGHAALRPGTTPYDGTGETRNARNVWTIAPQPYKGAHFATMPPALVERCILAGCPVGGHVLDPFGGAGTTGLVAARLGRNATLIELNPEYVGLQRERLGTPRAQPLTFEALL